ncbi:TPA: hypothetical protein DF272_01665 [Candidatus Falkowbacteria bacterium]|nr:hypothetical protein [Candidatus Falkowbacteria bacterium]
MDNIFYQISLLLGLVAAFSFVVHLLRQPLLISYIITGIVSGPVLLGIVNPEQDFYTTFSSFGVVLLLFVVGLSLNFTYLKKIGRVAIMTGLGQVVFTASLGLLIILSFGFNFISAAYLAVSLTFSSTIIIVKLLTDKKELESLYGQYTVGLMLVQDVIAIFLLLFIPLLSSGDQFWHTLAMWALKGVVMFSLVFSLSKFILPRILNKVAKSAEFLFIFTIAWCFSVASLAHLGGFSLEVGALMAGLSLGSTPYHYEIISRIKPLRDFFIMLFFIILGSQMNLANLGESLVPGLILALFVLIGNPFILYILFRLEHFTRRNSFLAGITAAQVSEFGFVLLFIGERYGHVSDLQISVFTIVALSTIFGSTYLVTYNKRIFRFIHPFLALFGRDSSRRQEEVVVEYDAWVFGYHRLGWKVVETLRQMKMNYAIVDFNPEYARILKNRGENVYFGDAADVDFLDELPLAKTKLVIMTMPDPDDQITAIQFIRKFDKKKQIVIIGTLNHASSIDDLYHAGANYVLMPHLMSGFWFSDILKHKPLTKHTFSTLRHHQERELAQRFKASSRV